METFKRNRDHDIKNVDIVCSFLAGMNIIGIIGLKLVFSSLVTYLLICITGGSIFFLFNLRKRHIYLKQITIEDGNLVFKTNFLFLSYSRYYQIEDVKVSRTYYSLILRCYKSGEYHKKKKFKLSSRNWKDLEDLEKILLTSKLGEEYHPISA
ncbi:hypothetical protein [Flammeovirga sp. SJP92]|uniref:hypothetical protein n=1 Tax=Flammeovirga sp. SJP92 TaxID=1775430 RepID=UPI00078708DD|nr:hypothetical protein [Flammeovirga sp. SJP92]KXX66828.1 hypothetical protein AVL50_30310 [Flammeovirga sp. SJP92]